MSASSDRNENAPNVEGDGRAQAADEPKASSDEAERRRRHTTIRNRRKTYLDRNPEYFSTDLELADPLLYDRLIRRFQTASEREAEGRAKGYSGVLEADLLRSEAKVAALANPDPNQTLAYGRGADGSILPEAEGEAALTKEDGESRWRQLMAWRFLRGDDVGFDYKEVDDNEAYDDEAEQRREEEEKYFGGEEPSWILEDGASARGETGVQDF